MQVTTFFKCAGRAQEAMTCYAATLSDSCIESLDDYAPGADGRAGVRRAVLRLAEPADGGKPDESALADVFVRRSGKWLAMNAQALALASGS